MGRNIYVVLGKKCKQSHAFEVEFDWSRAFATGGELPIKFKEVQLRNSGGTKIDKMIFDEYAEPPKQQSKRKGK